MIRQVTFGFLISMMSSCNNLQAVAEYSVALVASAFNFIANYTCNSRTTRPPSLRVGSSSFQKLWHINWAVWSRPQTRSKSYACHVNDSLFLSYNVRLMKKETNENDDFVTLTFNFYRATHCTHASAVYMLWPFCSSAVSYTHLTLPTILRV